MLPTETHKPKIITQTATYQMHVNIRTFCRIVLTSLTLGAVGLILDVDHWYATIKGWPDTRWIHHTLASTPSLLVLLSLLWGLVITALTLGWDHLETKALYMLSQEMKLEIALTNQINDEIPIDLLLDQQIGSIEIEQNE